jgi:cation diffusion facilitator family transporter
MDAPRPLARRVALLALGITLALTLAKAVAWLATSSLAMLSQTLDSLIDVVALSLVLVAVRIADKPADESHHYGHGKAENLVAFGQTVFLGALVLAVVFQAVAHLAGGVSSVEAPWYALALLGLSALVDVFRVSLLVRTARRVSSEALRAGAVNIAGDLMTALVALGSLIFVRLGMEHADAIGALFVATIVAYAAVRLARRSVDVLMDRAPELRVSEIEEAAARVPGVSETRRVRVRGVGDRLFADVTVAAGRTASLERAHDIAEQVEREIELTAPGTDVVVHVEPVSETTGLVERAQAAASRVQGVHEVHNVHVHAFHDRGSRKLHVTLHAKMDRGTSVAEAHDLSDDVEAAVTGELGSDVRVDTHIEPLVPTSFGEDTTTARPDVVEAVIAAALEEPDVLDCHEVLVTSAGAEISVVAHVHARRDLPLAQIHAASDRIEKRVHIVKPEVGQVLIHFEPGP